MANDFCLLLKSAEAFGAIDGVPYSVWTYVLSWRPQFSRRTTNPGRRLALTFSSRIAIVDPQTLPNLAAIQQTKVSKPDSGDVQYVYRDIEGRVENMLFFSFAAPSEVDTFTPVRISQQQAMTDPWTNLSFKVTVNDAEAAALQQVISGPATICPPCASPTPDPCPSPVPQSSPSCAAGATSPPPSATGPSSTDSSAGPSSEPGGGSPSASGAGSSSGAGGGSSSAPGASPSQRSRDQSKSARTLLKATINTILTSPQSATQESLKLGSALLKYGFATQMLLQHGEVRAVQQHLQTAGAGGGVPSSHPMWGKLELFEASVDRKTPAPPLSTLAEIPIDVLHNFGTAISRLREKSLQLARNSMSVDKAQSTEAGMAESATAAQSVQWRNVQMLAAFSHAANVASKGLAINLADKGVLPIGYMNLERLEMVPAGIVRGELIATIPLAPLEETSVVQKEWSVTSKEFTSIVMDSLENYSETGVTDNTELAQSTTSQQQHSNQFNITGTVTGGVGSVFTAQAQSGFTAQDSSSQSATESAKHSSTITQKASSRVKQEHKVTISTTTVTGTSETTTRTLKNSDPDNPKRIDYFSMMREWQVRLYRYGLRLTYDVVIPEPGGGLRQAHAYLAWLKSHLGPFTFNISH